jgi:hypothetical protein
VHIAAEIHLGPYRLPGTAAFPWLDGRIPRPEAIDRLDSLLDGDGPLIAMKRAVALTRYPAFFRDVARIEEETVECHAYAVPAVPGLLQTEEYARTMFTVWRPRRREDEIKEMVAARLARHRIVKVLRGQLEHIILRAQALSPAESVRHIEKLLQGEL